MVPAFPSNVASMSMRSLIHEAEHKGAGQYSRTISYTASPATTGAASPAAVPQDEEKLNMESSQTAPSMPQYLFLILPHSLTKRPPRFSSALEHRRATSDRSPFTKSSSSSSSSSC